MYNFRISECDEENKKKIQNYLKKVNFCQTKKKFDGCHGNVKNDRQTNDIS